MISTVLALSVTDLFTVQEQFFMVFFVFCFSLPGPPSATKKGFWFANACPFFLCLF